MRALYKKELRTFLSSIIGAVVLAVFLLVSGLFHWFQANGTCWKAASPK